MQNTFPLKPLTAFYFLLFSSYLFETERIFSYPDRNIKIIIESIYCKDTHDDGLDAEKDDVYLSIQKPEYSRTLYYKLKKGQKSPPEVIWEGSLRDGQKYDIKAILYNKFSGSEHVVPMGHMPFRLQNKFGYVLVDWIELENENEFSGIFLEPDDRKVVGSAKIDNSIEYPGTSTKALYRLNYIYLNWDKDNQVAGDKQNDSEYHVTIKIETY